MFRPASPRRNRLRGALGFLVAGARIEPPTSSFGGRSRETWLLVGGAVLIVALTFAAYARGRRGSD
jgi:hypothetical protein